MDLKTLCDKIKLPKAAFEIATETTITDQQYGAYKSLFQKNRDDFFIEVLKQKDSIKLFLCLFLKFACDAHEDYELRGISDEIYFDTFSDITIWCENCFRDSGEFGIKEYGWLWLHVELKVFRLGRLQFQPMVFDQDMIVNDKKMRCGDIVLNVHIPQGEPLDNISCTSSFKQAEQFFRGIPPIFICHSWLLYPGLKEVLKPDSNIIQFQDRFIIYDTEEGTREAEERIFINVSDTPDTYPENNSLQRNVKNYLISGKKLGSGLGIMV